jgi:predicted ribosomally synthesized peptide with SipW-like signal peptide
MARGGKNPKENRRLSVIPFLAFLFTSILLLSAASGGTLAWLTAQDEPVVNEFTPAAVDVKITEKVENNVKSSITIQNVSAERNIPVYIRVSLVANWVDANDKVLPEAFDLSTYIDTSGGWFLGADGYYYYSQPVAVGDSTGELLKATISLASRADGSRLEVTALAQAVQATKAAVEDAWPVTCSQDGGTISRKGGET